MSDVTFRTINWAQLVQKVEGDEFKKPEVVYEFSNGRKFEDSGPDGSFYERQ